jgi:hypothetical protein
MTHEKLHCLMVISNPCRYRRRYELARQFIERMRAFEEHIILYIVEMVYINIKDPQDPEFHMTVSSDPRHLQLTAPTPLWHKENMVNLGVRHLLPPDWKAMAWIDADIEFESLHWASDALRLLLGGTYDVVQLFSYAVLMNRREQALMVTPSFAQEHVRGMAYNGIPGINFWHPGFGYAITRTLYDKMGGLLDRAICGGGDKFMAFAFIGQIESAMFHGLPESFCQYLVEYQEKMGRDIRLGYLPTVLRHYFHGDRKNRKYTERWSILTENHYNPYTHVEPNEQGVLIPSPASFPRPMGEQILQYFQERNEDEEDNIC